MKIIIVFIILVVFSCNIKRKNSDIRYIHEKVLVKDTIIIHDTIRLKFYDTTRKDTIRPLKQPVQKKIKYFRRIIHRNNPVV